MSNNLNFKDRLCLALDVNSTSEALSIADEVSSYVGVFKVGLQLFTAEGPSIVWALVDKGYKVFLDLKLHDIPNTVEKTSLVIADLGVYMFNVHCSGSYAMMHQTMKSLREWEERTGRPRPLVLGVTVLTSISQQAAVSQLHLSDPIPKVVTDLSWLAKQAGLDGVVCSPQKKELDRLKEIPEPFLKVTPGIRMVGDDLSDQQRTSEPLEAIVNGSSMLVVGRPILTAKDKAVAATTILNQISFALTGKHYV